MRASFDGHVSFDLPYRYEKKSGINEDGTSYFNILCGTGINEDGEQTSELRVMLRRLDGELNEDKRNMTGSVPAVDMGKIADISMGVEMTSSSGLYSSNRSFSIHILIYVVAVGAGDGIYTMIGTKVARDSDMNEACECIARHMNAVFNCMKIDGVRPEIERITASRVMRTLKEGGATEDGGIGGGYVRPAEKRPLGNNAAAVKTKPAANPEPAPGRVSSETQEETALKEKKKREKAEEEAKKEKAWSKWESDCAETERKRKTAMEKAVNDRMDDLRRAAEEKRDAALDILAQEKAETEKERKETDAALAALGFFKIAEKKQLKAKMDRILNTDMPAHELRRQAINNSWRTEIEGIDNTIRNETESIMETVNEAYPMPPQPEKPERLLAEERRKEIERTTIQERNELLKTAIVDGLSDYGEMTVPEMIETIPALDGQSNQFVSALCRQLIIDGAIVKSTKNRRTYFDLP